MAIPSHSQTDARIVLLAPCLCSCLRSKEKAAFLLCQVSEQVNYFIIPCTYTFLLLALVYLTSGAMITYFCDLQDTLQTVSGPQAQGMEGAIGTVNIPPFSISWGWLTIRTTTFLLQVGFFFFQDTLIG